MRQSRPEWLSGSHRRLSWIAHNLLRKRCGMAEAGCEEPLEAWATSGKNSKKVGFPDRRCVPGRLPANLRLGITDQ